MCSDGGTEGDSTGSEFFLHPRAFFLVYTSSSASSIFDLCFFLIAQVYFKTSIGKSSPIFFFRVGFLVSHFSESRK
jgi:hypothetical protein